MSMHLHAKIMLRHAHELLLLDAGADSSSVASTQSNAFKIWACGSSSLDLHEDAVQLTRWLQFLASL